MVFDEDIGDLVLIMNGGWVVMTKECWQVLLQLFHGGVHMEPAGPTQGSLSLNYQSFEIWISQIPNIFSIFLLKTHLPRLQQKNRWTSALINILIIPVTADRGARTRWWCHRVQSSCHWWLPIARSSSSSSCCWWSCSCQTQWTNDDDEGGSHPVAEWWWHWRRWWWWWRLHTLPTRVTCSAALISNCSNVSKSTLE